MWEFFSEYKPLLREAILKKKTTKKGDTLFGRIPFEQHLCYVGASLIAFECIAVLPSVMVYLISLLNWDVLVW